jgi:hypothetical protein
MGGCCSTINIDHEIHFSISRRRMSHCKRVPQVLIAQLLNMLDLMVSVY